MKVVPEPAPHLCDALLIRRRRTQAAPHGHGLEILGAHHSAQSGTPGSACGVVDHVCDKDLVLIDTAGRSPRNTERMKDLHEFVKIGKPDELHLVMSVSVNNDVLKDTMQRFAAFPIHKLLLTKLDESIHYGIILSIISKTQKPIGYLTTGQEVPDDIEVATSRRLARLILNLDKIRG